MKRQLVAGCLMIVCGSALASTWKGGASGLWNDANNWDGGVPVANGTAEFSTDVTITDDIALPGKVTIFVDKDKTVNFNGVISDGASAGSIVVGDTADTGGVRAGSVHFNATNTFTGDLYVYHGKVYAGADNAFGAATSTAYVHVKPRDTKPQSATGIYLTDVDCLRGIKLELGSDNYRDYFNVDGDVTIGYMSSDVQFRGNFGKTKAGRCTWSGGGSVGSLFIPSISANSELYVTGEPVQFFPYCYSFDGKVTLASVGNKINLSHYNGTRIAYLMRCETNGAFSADSWLCFEDADNNKMKSELDLNSTTQSVARLYANKASTITDARNYGRVTSAKGGLITVNDTDDFDNYNVFQGEASVELNLTEGKTATFYAKSTSSGDLIASRGNVVFTPAGQWAGCVWVKAGTTVTMPSTAFARTTTVKLDGGTLVLPGKGIAQVAGIVDADGNPLPAGFYGKSAGSGVAALAGLEGEGQLAVVPPDPTVETTWEWQGGNGPNVSAWANWKDATADRKPDFGDPGNVLKFPTTAGTITLDVPVCARRLVVEGAETWKTVSFTATENGSLYLQAGGIDVADRQTAVNLSVPFRYHGDLSVSLPKQSRLWFNGSVTTVGGGALYVSGEGTAWFVGDGNFIDGNVVSSNGYVYVSGKDPLGGTGILEIRGSNQYSLMLSNAVLTRAVHRYNNAYPEGVCSGTTNWCSDITVHSGNFARFGVYVSNAELNIDGQVSQEGSLWIPYAYDASSTVRLCQKVDSRRYLYQDGGETGGSYGRIAFSTSGNLFQKQYCMIAMTFALEAEDAIDGEVIPKFTSNRASFDLCGTTQHIFAVCRGGVLKDGKVTVYGSSNDYAVKLYGGQVRGAPGSRLILTGSPTYGTADWTQDTFPRVCDAVSLERAGDGTTVVREPCVSTGEVAVTSGRLEFASVGAKWTWWAKENNVMVPYEQTCATAGSWAGDARVSGGTLALGHNQALSRDSDLYLEGGALEIAEGVTARVDHLYLKVAGEWEMQDCGLYGAADNTSVPANRRLSLITGKGLLRVRRPSGVAIIVR